MKDFFIGIDDGSSGIKLFDGKTCSKISSTGRSGLCNRSSLSGRSTSESSYKNETGDIYTVGAVSNPEETDYIGYQTSTLNQALVQHALEQAGIAGDNIKATFSLPFNQLYRSNGDVNQQAVRRKIDHVINNTFRSIDNGGTVRFGKGNVSVLAEGLAACFDKYITIDSGKIVENENEFEKQFAVVDVGGNTLDVCVVESCDILHNKSTSKQEHGVIEIYNNVIRILESHQSTTRFFEDGTPSLAITNAIKNGGEFKVGGKTINVTNQVKEAKNIVANSIKATLKNLLGSGFSMDEIIFVGGGSEILKKELLTLFEGSIIDQNPEYSNVKGLYKYSLYNSAG